MPVPVVKMRIRLWLVLLCVLLAAGCGKQEEIKEETGTEETVSSAEQEASSSEESSSEVPEETSRETETFRFVTAQGEWFDAELLPDVSRHDYDWELLSEKDGVLAYEDARYETHFGIDVSHHQGEIDWEAAARAGVEFAFIRIAYRGYGESGNLMADRTAAANLDAAEAAGIPTGVYIFSQAVNEEEAAEEAAFVLELLGGRELALPIVFDPELIRDDTARTDDVSGEQFTKNTRVFADAVRAAGYDVMIYANMFWEAFLFDLEALADVEIWYADYEPVPQTPYAFSFWQYSESGSVPGVNGPVDLDLWFAPAGN